MINDNEDLSEQNDKTDEIYLSLTHDYSMLYNEKEMLKSENEKLLERITKYEQQEREFWGQILQLEVENDELQNEKNELQDFYEEEIKQQAEDFEYQKRTSKPENEIIILKKEREKMFLEIDRLQKQTEELKNKLKQLSNVESLNKKYYERIKRQDIEISHLNGEIKKREEKHRAEKGKLRNDYNNHINKFMAQKMNDFNKQLSKRNNNEAFLRQQIKDLIDGKYTNKPMKMVKMLNYGYNLRDKHFNRI